MGILIGHYKNPYQPTRIMECHKGFEHCSIVNFSFFSGVHGFTIDVGRNSQQISVERLERLSSRNQTLHLWQIKKENPQEAKIRKSNEKKPGCLGFI